jgi:predicted Zn-dependent protease
VSTNRIELFEKMLATDPGNTSVLFGLAKEYEKAGRDQDLIDILNRYLEASDDEGNAFGMLASAYERIGARDKAREAYERGIETAQRHGHPGMAEEYRMTLAGNYED